jgi:hypothetical protein
LVSSFASFPQGISFIAVLCGYAVSRTVYAPMI